MKLPYVAEEVDIELALIHRDREVLDGARHRDAGAVDDADKLIDARAGGLEVLADEVERGLDTGVLGHIECDVPEPRESGMTSDCKHRSASDQHEH